ncbi:hypothetical protein DX914_13650 [Lysobacter silvisoli]|uniref:Uncharacterized protein n=1 Tax=Lysobacter silvisoli TaxID=2293254 RepID=A0A371K158_9GAMM|nr:DUF5694 domain-containing protein [Lysobacter silvisoli]RDZ27587.1 hypothetical protein DX914_13650 [Lysobacter silvisoli]
MLLSSFLASSPAGAQVDLSTLDRDMPGEPTRLLVLGSVHLNALPKGFERDSLQPLLDKLAAFKPDVITIEAISGEQCDLVARHPTIYKPEDIAQYCGNADAARAATGLDVPAAIAEARRLLSQWPDSPTPEQRRRLAAVFMAANEKPSAVVQWLQLPEAERRAGDGLEEALVAALQKSVQYNNENYAIGAVLAARLGLQRLHLVDDHTGDNIDVADGAAYGRAVQRAWSAAEAAAKPMRDRQAALSKSGDMLALYRYINRPDVLQLAIESDFGAALRDRSPERYGRLYVAGWEARNLRMVANIRSAFRERPGARVLSIVGSSHKPWFDAWLGQMQGVELVDAEQALK